MSPNQIFNIMTFNNNVIPLTTNFKEVRKMEKRIWIMPEKRDENFTNELLERFEALAKSLRKTNFSLEIKEQYATEDTPHFHFRVDFGNQTESACKDYIIASYDASANNETYEGTMRINFYSDIRSTYSFTLVVAAFAFYDEAIRKYYPEWTTHYKHIEY